MSIPGWLLGSQWPLAMIMMIITSYDYDFNHTCVIPWWWGCKDILEPNVIATWGRHRPPKRMRPHKKRPPRIWGHQKKGPPRIWGHQKMRPRSPQVTTRNRAQASDTGLLKLECQLGMATLKNQSHSTTTLSTTGNESEIGSFGLRGPNRGTGHWTLLACLRLQPLGDQTLPLLPAWCLAGE